MKASRARRKGALISLELLFVLPIVLAILFGIIEYSMLLAAEGRLAAASREGARVAAVGGDLTAVKVAVKNALPTNEKTLVDIQLVTTDTSFNAVSPGTTGDVVAVRVNVYAGLIVPDLLRFIGCSIQTQCLMGQTVMRKE